MKESRYTKKFISHVSIFMERMKLYPSSKRAFVGVSGGKDSMAMVYVLKQIMSSAHIDLTAVYVNHNLRDDSKDEEKFVTASMNQMGVPLKIFRLDESACSNVESWARDARYYFFKKVLREGDVFYLAHHIDDSFEWSLLTQMKSSLIDPTMGIPVVRGPYMRPFMSVTRNHIDNFIAASGIGFYEDSSNMSSKYERNFLRHEVVARLKERFPKMLKHYVYRSNDMAIRVGRHQASIKPDFIEERDSIGGVLLYSRDLSSDFRGADEQIVSIISSLSKKERGTLRVQVKKLIEACLERRKGPLTFSGGVLGYIMPGMLYFIHRDLIGNFEKMDRCISDNLRKLLSSEIPGMNISELRGKFERCADKFPGVIFTGAAISKNTVPDMKEGHPLLPKVTRIAKINNLKIYSVSRTIFSHENKNAKLSNCKFYFPDKSL